MALLPRAARSGACPGLQSVVLSGLKPLSTASFQGLGMETSLACQEFTLLKLDNKDNIGWRERALEH